MATGAVLCIRIHAKFDRLKFKRLVAVMLLASGVPLVLL